MAAYNIMRLRRRSRGWGSGRSSGAGWKRGRIAVVHQVADGVLLSIIKGVLKAFRLVVQGLLLGCVPIAVVLRVDLEHALAGSLLLNLVAGVGLAAELLLDAPLGVLFGLFTGVLADLVLFVPRLPARHPA